MEGRLAASDAVAGEAWLEDMECTSAGNVSERSLLNSDSGNIRR